MNKIVRVKDEKFTTISNVFLKDKNLSIKAKGFLAVVMGLPNSWEFSISGICSILKEGKTTIYSVIDELKEYNYCKVVVVRDEKGRISGTDYTFFEEPYTSNPIADYPYTENPDVDNQPQLNTNRINNVNNKRLKEEERNQKKEKDELFCQFETFAKEYKNLCGKHTVSGIKTLFNDFVKRHKDWKTVIPMLMPALHLEDQARKNAAARKEFYPMPKNLSTYLGKQRAWEVWTEDIGRRMTDEYTPHCDGISLFWNDIANCYITPFDITTLSDGYNENNRPDAAVVMWRGWKYIWNKERKNWVKE